MAMIMKNLAAISQSGAQARGALSELYKRAEGLVETTKNIEQYTVHPFLQIGSKVQEVNELFSKVTDGYRFVSKYSKIHFTTSLVRGGVLAGAHRAIFASLQFLSPFKFSFVLVFPLWFAMEFRTLTDKYLEYKAFKEEMEMKMEQMKLTVEQIQERMDFKLPMRSNQIDFLKIFFSENFEKFLTLFPTEPIQTVVQQPSSEQKVEQPALSQEEAKKSDVQEEVEKSDVQENVIASEPEQIDYTEQFEKAWQEGNLEVLEEVWQNIQNTEDGTSFSNTLAQCFEQAWTDATSQKTFRQVFEQVWAEQTNQEFDAVWEKIQQDEQTKTLLSDFEQAWENGNIKTLTALKEKAENSEEKTSFSTMIVHKAIIARLDAAAKRVTKEVKMVKGIFINQPLKKGLKFLIGVMKLIPEGFSLYELFQRKRLLRQIFHLNNPILAQNTPIRSRI